MFTLDKVIEIINSCEALDLDFDDASIAIWKDELISKLKEADRSPLDPRNYNQDLVYPPNYKKD